MATELTDGLWWFDLGRVNAYLYDGPELVLVDAGTPGKARALRDGVEAAGFELGDVDRVLVTHYDVDHVGGLGRMDDHLDAPVHLASPDAEYLTGEASPPLFSRKGLFQLFMGLSLSPPDLSVERVEDGDEVAGLTAFRTPGHTPGHVVFADETVAFLGDLVTAEHGELDLPPWYLNADTALVTESIRSFDDVAPDFEVATPGHGPPIRSDGRAALAALAERVA